MGVSTAAGPWRNKKARIEVVESVNGFYIYSLDEDGERVGDGKGMGDGVGLFEDDDQSPSRQIMVGTPDFYECMAEMVEMEGATLRAAYFGEDDESLDGIEVEED